MSHWTGYLGLNNERNLGFVRRNYSATAHWERRRGSHAQALQYCEKQDTRVAGPYRVGDVPENADAGDRNDLRLLVDAVRGGGLKRARDECPELLIRYPRGAQLLQSLEDPPPRPPPRVFLFYGNTGLGKTRRATEIADDAGAAYYIHEPFSPWFDGYTGQPYFILDDFSGWLKLEYLLRLLDRYSFRLQIKGASTYLTSTHIFITTNIHPAQWYDYTGRTSQYAALARRIHVVRLFGDGYDAVADGDRFWALDTMGPISVDTDWLNRRD